jgi:sugar lactone lactonase YvrE
VLLRDLQFANGVALAPDDSYVLFAETGLFRISKYWLTGDKAGHVDVILDDIEGFPDNLSRGSDGTFWVGLTAPRNPAFDALAPYPLARKIVARLPEVLQPQPARAAHVLAIDGTGHIKQSYSGDGTSAAFVSGAVEHAGWLYLASLTEPQFARVPLKP